MKLVACIVAEYIKLKKSTITWFLALAFGFGPLVSALFMIVFQNQELGKKLGLLNTKAQLAITSADWPSYLAMISQVVGVGGMVIIGICATYIFGREYTEGTAKSILTLPISRSNIVISKILACAVWYIVIGLWILIETFIFG